MRCLTQDDCLLWGLTQRMSQIRQENSRAKADLTAMRSLKRAEIQKAYDILAVGQFRYLDYEEDPIMNGRQEIRDRINILRSSAYSVDSSSP